MGMVSVSSKEGKLLDSFVGSMKGGSLGVFSACRGEGWGSHFLLAIRHQVSVRVFWVILFIGGGGCVI